MAKIETFKDILSNLETSWNIRFHNQTCKSRLNYDARGEYFLYWDSDNGFRLIFEHREVPLKKTILLKDGIIDSTYFNQILMQKFVEGLIEMENKLAAEVPDDVIKTLKSLVKRS